MQQKRNLGGSESAPILVCIIPLQEDLNIDSILSIITKADDSANIINSPCNTIHLRYDTVAINNANKKYNILIIDLLEQYT